MIELSQHAVDAARKAGAGYADARLVSEDTESITVRNETTEGLDRSTSSGVGIRVLVDGSWGFAATSRTEPEDIERTARLAVDIAGASSSLPSEGVRLAPEEPLTGEWTTSVLEDPFEVPLAEKIELLAEATARMRTVPGVAFAEGSLDFFQRRTFFASSEGAVLTQRVVHSGGGVEAIAIAEGEMQRRSHPNSFRGHLRAAGYEHIRALDLGEGAERAAGEAVQLLSAPDCPADVTTVVLDSSQMILQVHESV
jgi:TldD protein